MMRMIATVCVLGILIPYIGAAQDMPERPWGQVYQEDIVTAKGAYETPVGFYIDGVRVSPEAYVLHDELNKTRRRLNDLREEIRESNLALMESLPREESTARVSAELAEIRRTLQDLTQAMKELGRLMMEKQRE
ncbi:MAG: hypothetical protein AB1512_04505 [Thermodesulfobacteriota bacterium]